MTLTIDHIDRMSSRRVNNEKPITMIARRVGATVWMALGVGAITLAPRVEGQGTGPLRPAASLRPSAVVGDTHPLNEIRDVVQVGDTLVVLTSGSPAVHVFSPTAVSTWGRAGQGPGELENATSIARRAASLSVLETSPGQSTIELFDLGGAHRGTVRLRGYGIVARFASIVGGFLVESAAFGQPERTLVAISDSGALRDTVIQWSVAPRITLAPARGPRFGTSQPFAAAFRWAALANGDIAVWNPGDTDITFIGSERRRTRIALPVLQPLAVSAADHDAWLTRSFPERFMNMGDDPLRDVREEARRVLKFPQVLPQVLALQRGSGAVVWVQRSPASQGEEWIVLDEHGGCRRIRLPVGRELLSVDATSLAARAVDSLGVERVERYRMTELESSFAQCRSARR